MEVDICDIIDEFEADVKTTPAPLTPQDPPASVLIWLSQHYTELLEVVNAKRADEVLIATQMESEINTWLSNHIEDLQEALSEICNQEHAYHYTPPGFHVDETAVDL